MSEIIPTNIKYVDGNYYDTIKVVESDEIEDRKKGLELDGIIYQPKRGSYKNNDTWKWKPPELLTIDFYLQSVEGKKDTFNLMIKSPTNKYEVFIGDDSNPYSGEVTIENANLDEINGQIVEMGGDFSKNNFFEKLLRKIINKPHNGIFFGFAR